MSAAASLGAIAALMLGVWIGVVVSRRKIEVAEHNAALRALRTSAAPALAYSDAPTVRLGDSQRIDRLHRVVSLKAGEHADLLDLTFDRIPRLRVAFAAIESVESNAERQTSAQSYARIQIELGGAIAGCGALVKEVKANEFLVPLATTDEQRCSIIHIYGADDAMSFLRVKVLQLKAEDQSANIDVLHVCGQWAA